MQFPGLKILKNQKNIIFAADPPSPRLRRMKGEMAEWSNAAVLKTVVRLPADRGFESLFLRQNHQISPVHRPVDGIFVFEKPESGLPE